LSRPAADSNAFSVIGHFAATISTAVIAFRTHFEVALVESHSQYPADYDDRGPRRASIIRLASSTISLPGLPLSDIPCIRLLSLLARYPFYTRQSSNRARRQVGLERGKHAANLRTKPPTSSRAAGKTRLGAAAQLCCNCLRRKGKTACATASGSSANGQCPLPGKIFISTRGKTWR
jgi:hypothetical protein